MIEARVPLELCHLCGKADAVTRSASAAANHMDMSATVVLPERLCGRCIIQIAEAALGAATTKYAAMKGKRL